MNTAEYSSIFEQPKLSFLKKLHDKYGIVVSFYTYYSWDVESNRFDLSMMTDRYHEEFSKNSDWLRFGFHAKDADAYENCSPEENLEYYNKTISELLRITGSVECIDNFVRLDRYQADAETIKLLQNTDNGIVGLLAADDPNRQSYALSVTEMRDMNTNDWLEDESGVSYTPTDIRLENIKSDFILLKAVHKIGGQKRIVVFTHEWVLDDAKVQKYMESICRLAKKHDVSFDFPEERR